MVLGCDFSGLFGLMLVLYGCFFFLGFCGFGVGFFRVVWVDAGFIWVFFFFRFLWFWGGIFQGCLG